MTDEKPETGTSFTPESISRLSPREHIRLRPGMYFGGTDKRALIQLIYEVVENSVAQAIAGLCTSIAVNLSNDAAVTISDDSPGIPLDIVNESGQSVLDLVFTDVGYLHGKNDTADYSFRSKWWGLGLAVVNAGCIHLIVEVKRDGHLWRQTYKEGEPQSKLARVRTLNLDEQTGTTISFTPDFTIFDQNEFDFTALYRRLRELAYLVPDLTITLEDRRTQPKGPPQTSMHFPGGTKDFVKHLNRNHHTLHEPIAIRQKVELKKDRKPMGITADIDIALQYSDVPQTLILSYVNMFEITDEGTHIDGLKSGLGTGIYAVTQKMKLREGFSEYDRLNGLTAVVSIWHPSPRFESSRTAKLINGELHDPVYHLVWAAFKQALEARPNEMERIIDHLLNQKYLRDSRRFGE